MGYRYIGSKNKLLDEITKKVRTLVPEGSHVVDLMCGTGAVAQAFTQIGYRVTAADVMTYAYHHARIEICFAKYPDFKSAKTFIEDFSENKSCSYANILSALNAVPTRKNYFWKEFSSEGQPAQAKESRNYFSPENAKKIDGIRYWIKKLKQEKKISEMEHSLLLHDLIMAANDVANIAGTYGHYLSRLMGRAHDTIKLKPSNLYVAVENKRNRVIKGYAEEISKDLKCDLCYIDPPYMKRQYAANYHLLETIAREDSPPAIGVSGLRPWRDQYSNFCTKTKIRDSFRTIFREMDCPNFLISYSEDGLLKIGELESLLSEFGKVSTEKLKYKRFKSNDSKLAPELTEYLIHLVKD